MSFSPVHEPPHRQNQKEGDIGGNDGSGKVGVSYGSLSPPVPDERENEGNERRPCANPKGKRKQRKAAKHHVGEYLKHHAPPPPLRVAWWTRLL